MYKSKLCETRLDRDSLSLVLKSDLDILKNCQQKIRVSGSDGSNKLGKLPLSKGTLIYLHFRVNVRIQNHYLELNGHNKMLPQSFNAKRWLFALKQARK